MTIRARTAKRVCTQAEFKLFADSRMPILRTLTIPQLQRRQVKSRQACRKAHERAAKLKGKVAGKDFDNAVRRVEVLEEVSGRFDRRLQKQLVASTGKGERTRRRKLRVRRQLKVTPAARSKRVEKTTHAKKSRFEEGATPRIEGHVSSRDRRRQVLQDQRR